MEGDQKKPLNKDLILREKLAIERTKMANDRTFLSFLCISLYFSIAGMTINELVYLSNGIIAETVFWGLSVALLIAGVIKYLSGKRKIRANYKHLGRYLLEIEDGF